MKQLFVVFTMLVLSHFASARELEVVSCEEGSVRLNSVWSMKSYANGTVKTFEVDMEEPASAPAGIAVAIDRGNDLSDLESFCRYVPGLRSVVLQQAKSAYNKKTGVLTLTITAYESDDGGRSVRKVLTVAIDKAAKNESDLVKASLN